MGQLVESALKDPPWAVEQAGRGYLQMGELAYRVAEQANGDQTIDEMATAVSAAMQRPVSAVDVEALITTVLIPRGVVTGPNGQQHGEDPDDPAPGGPPVLGQHAAELRSGAARRGHREHIVGRARLEAVAAVLMWLFWPPVMVVVLGAAFAALTWLYTMHGLAAGVIQVLMTPVLLPFALALAALVSTAQGIGPMVALYGSGATIERLCFTPRLRHPGLAIDVADDYGLSRWARLTVNLSGVYLQLFLTLTICLLATVTRAEFLYLTAALLTLNVLRLLLPFGRRDADRLLADLLLVQHPLRYAEQALGRWARGVHPSSGALPPLKRWGYVTIGLYLLGTLSALVVVGIALLWATPTVVMTTLEALLAYLATMVEAVPVRDVVGFVDSLLKATVLGATSFGLAVVAVMLVLRLVTRAWTWSQPTPRRRILGGLGALAATVVLVVFWVPTTLPGPPDPTGGEAPRSLAGVPFRSLMPGSRGTLLDLFSAASNGHQPAHGQTLTRQ